MHWCIYGPFSLNVLSIHLRNDRHLVQPTSSINIHFHISQIYHTKLNSVMLCLAAQSCGVKFWHICLSSTFLDYPYAKCFVPKGPINNIPALVQMMAWHRPGNKQLSEPMMVRLLMHICITRPQWVNKDYTASITQTSPWTKIIFVINSKVLVINELLKVAWHKAYTIQVTIWHLK